MHVISARNVEDALHQGTRLLKAHGRRRSSRNGEVVVMDAPVTTMYRWPRERVLRSPERDANPFFHLFESLWMLAGRRDVDSVAWYVKRMRSYSDDGSKLHGAYGHRWRLHFGEDQLAAIRRELRHDPDSRRAVLDIWDAREDLGRPGRDLPCNLTAHFQRSYTGALDMTVFCRSNDIIWGAYGANAVHFSVLQEYLAAGIGCPIGTYWQISSNFHAYAGVLDKLQLNPHSAMYARGVEDAELIFDLVQDPARWDIELRAFMRDDQDAVPEDYGEPFFRHVAVPMHLAYGCYKRGALNAALSILRATRLSDWTLAGQEWIQRRLDRRREDAVHPQE